MATTKEAIGQRLKAARAGKGLSISEASKCAGLSRNYLHMVERGEPEVSIIKLTALAELYAVPLDALVYGKDGDDGDLSQLVALYHDLPWILRVELIEYAKYLGWRKHK